jgi:hypothetical protein
MIARRFAAGVPHFPLRSPRPLCKGPQGPSCLCVFPAQIGDNLPKNRQQQQRSYWKQRRGFAKGAEDAEEEIMDVFWPELGRFELQLIVILLFLYEGSLLLAIS